MSRVGLTGKISQSIVAAESQEEKLEILQKYKNETLIKRIVEYAYNPLLDFGMSDFDPKNTGKEDGMGLSKFMHVLDDILAGKFDKDEATFACNLALSYIHEFETDIFVGMLRKDLNWGLEQETINAVWDDVNLGYPLQNPSVWNLQTFKSFNMPVVAQKLYQGLRINIKVTGSNFVFLHKDGTPFHELDVYGEQFLNLAQHGDTVYDGIAMLVKDHKPVDATDQEILEADPADVKFVLWDAIRYDGFKDGKDNRIGYNWRANGLEHMMMLAIEKNPQPCYSMPANRVCGTLDEVREFCEANNCDAVVKNLSGTWRGGETNQELIFRK
jgi:hypothetical protein